MYCLVLSAIYIAAPTGVPPAAATDCRLAQPVTPETVYSPTQAGRRSKPRNLILCLAGAGFEPTTYNMVVQRLTTVPTRQAIVPYIILRCLKYRTGPTKWLARNAPTLERRPSVSIA